MNRIKLTLSALVILIGFSVNAQEVKQKGNKSDKLATALGLDEKQKSEVDLIMKESRKDMNALKANAEITEEEKRKATKEIKAGKEIKLASVFTEEQAKLYKEMNEKEQEVRNGKREDRMAAQLGLSDQQSIALEAIKKKAKAERRVISSNEELSKEEKAKQLKQVRKKMDAQTKEVLTAEQYAKMKAIKADKKVGKGQSKSK